MTRKHAVIGLDVSTSVIGWTVLELDGSVRDMGHVTFPSKCKTIFSKAEHARDQLVAILSVHAPLDAIFIEESLQAFRPGLSSIKTILMLAKFNALVSFFVRAHTGIEPTYLAATTARKACGIKIQKTKVCGKPGKQQAFEWALAGPLKSVAFSRGKTGNYKPFVYDEVDSYVIALAGHLLHKPKP